MRERLYIQKYHKPFGQCRGQYYLSAKASLAKYWSDAVPQYFRVNESALQFENPTWFSKKIDASLAGSMHGWDVVDITNPKVIKERTM